MLPIFFIISLLIAAGLLIFGYFQRAREAILMGGIVLILLGVSAAANNVDYASGTNTTIFAENEYLPHEWVDVVTISDAQCTADCPTNTTRTSYLLMNSTTTETETIIYSQTTGIINQILGVILALIGLYFIIAAVTLI